MLTRLKTGRVFDPAQNLNGEICDICFADGFILPTPDDGKMPDVDYDISGKIVMAGAVDIHSHIAGGIEMTLVKELKKEFSLYEIAIMTRTAAAQMLGLKDRGHLKVGAIADIAVYDTQHDKEKMFSNAALVFKNGELVVKNGEVQTRKKATTQIMQPHFNSQIKRDVQAYYDQFYNLKLHNFQVEEVSFNQTDTERFVSHQCGKPYESHHATR